MQDLGQSVAERERRAFAIYACSNQTGAEPKILMELIIIKKYIKKMKTYLSRCIISLSQLCQGVLGDSSVRYVGDLMNDGCSKYVTYSVYVVQNAGNQLGQEHKIIPVGCLIRGQTHNVTITTAITLKKTNIISSCRINKSMFVDIYLERLHFEWAKSLHSFSCSLKYG